MKPFLYLFPISKVIECSLLIQKNINNLIDFTLEFFSKTEKVERNFSVKRKKSKKIID